LSRNADNEPIIENVFLSPLKTVKLVNNRTRKVSMRMITAGEPAVITLSYPSMAAAKQARSALVQAGNVYAVGSEALWRAIAASLKTVAAGPLQGI
jgi:hypothetical protein